MSTVGKGGSKDSYTETIKTLADCYPDDPVFSIYQICRRMQLLTGIIPIWNNMCNSARIGFSGPFPDLENCPECIKSCYHPNTLKPVKQFLTIPSTPWLQAFYQSLITVEMMHYRECKTSAILKYADENGGRICAYNDTICEKNYLEAVRAGKIRKQDIVLQASQDGAQIYQDCPKALDARTIETTAAEVD
ncbi:hypothetical protein PQX77_018138 [Marasmius sp. AFHP31]|nr:hypothetical protein PQX77_018138 [Marasmius sp. AFHP31]